MSKGGGGSAPTETTQIVSNLPEYAEPFYRDLMARVGYESAVPYDPYPAGGRLEYFTPSEQEALRRFQQLGVSGTPDELLAAGDIAAQVGQGNPYTGSMLAATAGAQVPSTYTAGQSAFGFLPGADKILGSLPRDYQAGVRQAGYYARDFNPGYSPQQLDSGFDAERLGPGYQAGPFDPGYQAGDIQQGYTARDLDVEYQAGDFDPGYQAGDIGQGYTARDLQSEYRAGVFDPGYQAGEIGQGYQARDLDVGYQAGDFDPGYVARELGQDYSARDLQSQYAGDLDIGPGFEAGTIADPRTIEAYMSPYQQLVVDREKEEARRQSRIMEQQLGLQAAGAGSLGGYREAIMQAERQRNL